MDDADSGRGDNCAPVATQAIASSPQPSPRSPPSPLRAPPGLLVSYLQFSNIRSQLNSTPVKTLLDAEANQEMALDMHAPALPPSLVLAPCVDCVADCDEPECPLSPARKECTDRCLVIACTDTEHQLDPCFDDCLGAACAMDSCDGGADCAGDLDEFLQCCTDYHSYFESRPASSPMNWDISDLLNEDHRSRNFLPPAAGDQSRLQNNFEPNSLFQSFDPPRPPAITSPRQYTSSVHHNSPSMQSFSPRAHHAAPTHACKWGNCGAKFPSMSDLVGHVNLVHLRPSSQSPAPPPSSRVNSPPAQRPYSNAEFQNAISCLWGDCQSFLPAYSAAPSFRGQPVRLPQDAALEMLSSHLLHDHLGLSAPPPPSFDWGMNLPSPRPQPALPFSPRASSSKSGSGSGAEIPTPETSPSLTPSPSPGPGPASGSGVNEEHHDCSQAAHVCRWAGCGRSFALCDELTAHLSSDHVGSGKSQYHCFWNGCNRNGEQGFASKQKILRHLQSHTGHRPFQCQLCGQNFSEAATLQQHMRRHTQEKPFICDFPGCGKAFAITGALTIHKRTHNGEKPFKCPHCDRGFAESSNLSKHLRTHTGARPYPCPEPGCEKAFARPDQLARHAGVHARKRVVQGEGPSDFSQLS